jgi:hypothetical protein
MRPSVAKPTKRRGKWLIRWVDRGASGKSAFYDEYGRADGAESVRVSHVAACSRTGPRGSEPPRLPLGP